MNAHLILVNEPGFQSIADFEEIREEIERIAPDLSVHLAYNTLSNARLLRQIGTEPLVVVCFSRLKSFQPRHGRIYQGRQMSKLAQMDALRAAGVRAPRSILLTSDLKLDEREWGEFLVLKPNFPKSTMGKGVHLVRTRSLRYRAPHEYPEGHPGRKGPMLVQQYIHTGVLPSHYRVLSLFGEALYCAKVSRLEGELELNSSDEDIEGFLPAPTSGARHREFAYEPDLRDFALEVHNAVPDVPLKGIDILREENTGLLYCVEFNPGGNTWHFSSKGGRRRRIAIGERRGVTGAGREAKGRAVLIEAFDAFRTAARVLARIGLER